MKKILTLALLMLAFLAPAHALDRHACVCDAGRVEGCVPGTASFADSTNPLTPMGAITSSTFSSLAAGDRILMCQGGSQAGVALNLGNASATVANPITLGTYAASWGGTGVKPILSNTTGTIVHFAALAGLDGGYIVDGFRIDGGGTAGRCIQLYNTTRNITIRNSEITGCAIGINLEAFNETDQSPNKDVAIYDNTIFGNYDIGIYGSADGGLIGFNTFHHNGDASGLTHHIYLGYRGRGMMIFGNDFSSAGRSLSDPDSSCTGGNITVHGKWDGLHIVGNRIVNSARTYVCAGIKVNTGYSPNRPEWFNDVLIDSNLIVNTFVGIGLAAAHEPTIQNNLIVNAGTAINIADTGIEAGIETPDFGALISNNSIFASHPTDGLVGINLSGNHGAGTGVKVRGNLIRFAAGSVTKTCFQHGARSNFTEFNRNGCSNESGGSFNWSSSFATLAAAQAGCPASGFDCNGLSSDPLLVTTPTGANGGNMRLQAGSPYIGASTNCPRVTVTSRIVDTCSIGAFQSVDTE